MTVRELTAGVQQQLLLKMIEVTATAILAPLFNNFGVTPQVVLQLQDKPVQAECFLLRLPQTTPQQPTDSAEPNTLLQVVGQFVVERSLDGTQVLSAFHCDYEIQFEILRKTSPIPNKLGEAEGIRFIFRGQGNQMVELQVKPERRNELQNFGRVLGFHTAFKAIKKIGKGMTACVYNALNFATGREVAIKSFKRSVYFQQDNGNGKISFRKEFKILTEINHKNLCQIFSVYQTDNSTYVVLELYPLSLYGYLQKFGFPNEEQAKGIMINLLEGIAYLHDLGIMHRDLKLQNIMVRKDDNNNGHVIPVIVDLGLAEYTSSQKYLYTRCGTPGYVAPEVLKLKSTDLVQIYSQACDIFSLGVIFYILFFRKPLFQGKDVKQVIKKNCQSDINFQSELFKSLTPTARDLFERMLTRDPIKRITARDALNHPFLSRQKMNQLENELEAPNIFNTEYSIRQ